MRAPTIFFYFRFIGDQTLTRQLPRIRHFMITFEHAFFVVLTDVIRRYSVFTLTKPCVLAVRNFFGLMEGITLLAEISRSRPRLR